MRQSELEPGSPLPSPSPWKPPNPFKHIGADLTGILAFPLSLPRTMTNVQDLSKRRDFLLCLGGTAINFGREQPSLLVS